MIIQCLWSFKSGPKIFFRSLETGANVVFAQPSKDGFSSSGHMTIEIAGIRYCIAQTVGPIYGPSAIREHLQKSFSKVVEGKLYIFTSIYILQFYSQLLMIYQLVLKFQDVSNAIETRIGYKANLTMNLLLNQRGAMCCICMRAWLSQL